ncbi:MAG: VWA domain-containing protein [Acidobacteriaceae bacterium]
MPRCCRLPLAFAALVVVPAAGLAQSTPHPPASAPYTLRIPVDEIALTFHAAAHNGAPLTHLTRQDLTLTDNGRRQPRIVFLQNYDDLPIRAGFLFDTSASMLGALAFNRAIIRAYAAQLLRKGYDRAFVEQFDTKTFIRQNWTDSVASIAAGAARVGNTPDRYDPLTAIFDSLYTTCRDQWQQDPNTPTGNFILLFSDGVDDASHAYLSEAVDMCQRTRTAVYAIVTRRSSQFSDGYRTLQDLTQQTGGRLFSNPHGSQILDDLRIMESEQRNQYRLVYKPTNFQANGSFHRIRLHCSVPGAHITARSGYYASPRP